MESSRSKRRRLISVSSNVSSQWPDLPAIFESLNDDTLTTVLEFVGGKSYRSFGGVNKHCKEVYLNLNTPGMTKETFLFGYGPLSRITNIVERDIEGNDWELQDAVAKGVVFYNRRDVLAWLLQQRKMYVLSRICDVAGEEGRIDILDEVFSYMNDRDDKSDIFRHINFSASRHGKLNVLKWLETKGLSFNKKGCGTEAAKGGQLHILKWLQEEKGLELYSSLYNSAALRGQLHVMKWLREQEVPWDTHTFMRAAEGGNLDIIQWLHDEGCPWNRRYRVGEDRLYSGAIDWCRANGYEDRIVFFFQ